MPGVPRYYSLSPAMMADSSLHGLPDSGVRWPLAISFLLLAGSLLLAAVSAGSGLYVVPLATAPPRSFVAGPLRRLPPVATAISHAAPEEPDWGTLGGFALKQAKKQWRVEIAPLLPLPGIVTPWRELIGTPLTQPTGGITPWAQLFEGPDAPPLVGLYFGARHCRPCKMFLNQFVKAYNAMNAKGRRVEILFASMDYDEEGRNQYLQERPYFLGLPYELGGMLQKGWKVTSTPAVFIMDPRTGHLLSHNARQEIEDMGSKAADVWMQRLQQVPYAGV